MLLRRLLLALPLLTLALTGCSSDDDDAGNDVVAAGDAATDVTATDEATAADAHATDEPAADEGASDAAAEADPTTTMAMTERTADGGSSGRWAKLEGLPFDSDATECVMFGPDLSLLSDLGGGTFAERIGDDGTVGCKFETTDGSQLLLFAGPSPIDPFEDHVRNNSAFSVNTVTLGTSEAFGGGTLQPFCGDRSDGEECFTSWYDGDIELVVHGSAVPGEISTQWMRSHLDGILATIDAFDPSA